MKYVNINNTVQGRWSSSQRKMGSQHGSNHTKRMVSLSRNMGIGNQQLLVHVEKPLQESVGKKAPWAVKKADFLYFEDHR